MKKLLTSGCSWTSGWPREEHMLREKFTWPNLVANHFDCDLVDKSRAGSSNYRIYRKSFEGIIDSSIDTVIVFLTSWTRWETGSTIGEKPARIYQHLIGGNDSKIFRNFFNGYKQITDAYRMIISLQNLAHQYSTRCYFLDTFNNNVYNKDTITLVEFKKILQYNIIEYDSMDDERIIEKYHKAVNLYKNIKKQTFVSLDSYQEIINDCKLEKNHPGEDGHQKVADVVINFLEGEDIGQTI